jgi:hypothetical protein
MKTCLRIKSYPSEEGKPFISSKCRATLQGCVIDTFSMANPPQAELSYTFAGKRDQKVPDCEIKGLLRSLKDRLIPSLSIILTPHLSNLPNPSPAINPASGLAFSQTSDLSFTLLAWLTQCRLRIPYRG